MISLKVRTGKEPLMKWLMNRTKSFLMNEDGPTASEYAIMLALIIVAAFVGITLIGTKDKEVFTAVSDGLPSS
jgi:pilus assembly protein Flp/PilA